MSKYSIDPVWILSEARTGSTFLSNTLNETKFFNPIFKEYFHDDKMNKFFRDKELLLHFNSKWPKFAKMHGTHFANIRKSFPILKIKKLIPNLKFIHLRRKNLVKQAISLYFCSKTKYFIVKNKKDLNKYKKIKVDYNEENILNIYNKMIFRFNFWKPILTNQNYIDVYYEDLIDNPKKTFLKIFKFIGIEMPDNLNTKSTLVQSHPLKKVYEKMFIEFLKKNNHPVFINKVK